MSKLFDEVEEPTVGEPETKTEDTEGDIKMKTYEIHEPSHVVNLVYRVNADSEEEALEKVANGEAKLFDEKHYDAHEAGFVAGEWEEDCPASITFPH